MARNALSLLAPLRAERTFAVAAEGSSTLRIESGLATIHHRHPPAALLQTRLLRWFLEPCGLRSSFLGLRGVVMAGSAKSATTALRHLPSPDGYKQQADADLAG